MLLIASEVGNDIKNSGRKNVVYRCGVLRSHCGVFDDSSRRRPVRSYAAARSSTIPFWRKSRA